MNFQGTPRLPPVGGRGLQRPQVLPQSRATPPPPQRQVCRLSSPHGQAIRSNSSSQNSEHAPSIISVSSSSPYQGSSGSGPGAGALPVESLFSDQLPQTNSFVITPRGRGRGSSIQHVVIRQLQQEEGPQEGGVGRGRGGKPATPTKRGGGGGGGGRKTPHTPAPAEPAEDDEIQIVVDKGASSGRRGGAASKRTESVSSGGADVNQYALTGEQRAQRTRENEKKRRAMHKESAAKLRDLLPGLDDGKSRKVGEGIVMQKAGDYIEELQKQLKTHRETAKAAKSEIMREIAHSDCIQRKCIIILNRLRSQYCEQLPRTLPPFPMEVLAPTLKHIKDAELLEEIWKMTGVKPVNACALTVVPVRRTSAAGQGRPIPMGTSTGGTGIHLLGPSGGGRAVVRTQAPSPGFIPITGIPQGMHQVPALMSSSQAHQRSVAIQRSELHQQLVISTMAAQRSEYGALPPGLALIGQGQQQLARIVPAGYRSYHQRLMNSQCLIGSQARIKIGSSPIPGVFALQQHGSMAGSRIIRINPTPSPQAQNCLVNYAPVGLPQEITSGASEASASLPLPQQQIDHLVVGGGGRVNQEGLSEPMSLINLKQEVEEEEPQVQKDLSRPDVHSMEQVFGQASEQGISVFENAIPGGGVNLLQIKSEPMDVDEVSESADIDPVAIPGLLAIKQEEEVDGDKDGTGSALVPFKKSEEGRIKLADIRALVEEDDEEESEEELERNEDSNPKPGPSSQSSQSSDHPGWRIPSFGDLVSSSDEDEDFELQRSTNPLVENRLGAKVKMGVNRAMEEAFRLMKKKDETFGQERSGARFHHQLMPSIAKPTEEENLARWAAHDELFRKDELFKHDYVWGGYRDDPSMEKRAKEEAAQLWKEVVHQRQEEDRKEAEENQRREEEDDCWGEPKRKGGRGAASKKRGGRKY